MIINVTVTVTVTVTLKVKVKVNTMWSQKKLSWSKKYTYIYVYTQMIYIDIYMNIYKICVYIICVYVFVYVCLILENWYLINNYWIIKWPYYTVNHGNWKKWKIHLSYTAAVMIYNQTFSVTVRPKSLMAIRTKFYLYWK